MSRSAKPCAWRSKAMRTAGAYACRIAGTSIPISPTISIDFVKLENVLAIHDVPGGTAPARVREAIAAARKKVGSVREEAHAHA